jgi:hypothetical protein
MAAVTATNYRYLQTSFYGHLSLGEHWTALKCQHEPNTYQNDFHEPLHRWAHDNTDLHAKKARLKPELRWKVRHLAVSDHCWLEHPSRIYFAGVVAVICGAEATTRNFRPYAIALPA